MQKHRIPGGALPDAGGRHEHSAVCVGRCETPGAVVGGAGVHPGCGRRGAGGRVQPRPRGAVVRRVHRRAEVVGERRVVDHVVQVDRVANLRHRDAGGGRDVVGVGVYTGGQVEARPGDRRVDGALTRLVSGPEPDDGQWRGGVRAARVEALGVGDQKARWRGDAINAGRAFEVGAPDLHPLQRHAVVARGGLHQARPVGVVGVAVRQVGHHQHLAERVRRAHPPHDVDVYARSGGRAVQHRLIERELLTNRPRGPVVVGVVNADVRLVQVRVKRPEHA